MSLAEGISMRLLLRRTLVQYSFYERKQTLLQKYKPCYRKSNYEFELLNSITECTRVRSPRNSSHWSQTNFCFLQRTNARL